MPLDPIDQAFGAATDKRGFGRCFRQRNLLLKSIIDTQEWGLHKAVRIWRPLEVRRRKSAASTETLKGRLTPCNRPPGSIWSGGPALLNCPLSTKPRSALLLVVDIRDTPLLLLLLLLLLQVQTHPWSTTGHGDKHDALRGRRTVFGFRTHPRAR